VKGDCGSYYRNEYEMEARKPGQKSQKRRLISSKKILALPVTDIKKIGSVGREGKLFFWKIFLFVVFNFELLKVCITHF